METTTIQSPMRVAAKWGVITGLANIILFMVRYLALGVGAMDNSWSQTLISVLIICACLFLGVKEQRDQAQGGYITFGRAFGTGMLICLFFGIIGGFFSYMFFKFGDSGLIQQALDTAEERMREKGTPDEQIEVAMNMTRKFMTPGIMGISGVFVQLLMGLIPALVIAGVVQKKQAEPGF